MIPIVQILPGSASQLMQWIFEGHKKSRSFRFTTLNGYELRIFAVKDGQEFHLDFGIFKGWCEMLDIEFTLNEVGRLHLDLVGYLDPESRPHFRIRFEAEDLAGDRSVTV